ncbi:12-oxophytodienoic acid reductase [Acrasis kona]|uniref:12-oxophytodienoic acid reductase n=1 Tax=Acrasis kona TaxID=1008807 RepID=A0AAW2YU86_9EUKA
MAEVTAFSPLQIGDLNVANRVWMSPMTRSRGKVPNDIVSKYYQQRSLQQDNSGAGLIVTEGVLIEDIGTEYGSVPGIFSEEQISGWKKVVDEVHKSNSVIFAQLWHVGRISHSLLSLNNAQPVGPSAIRAPKGNFRQLEGAEYEVPRALTTPEVSGYAKLFGDAARNSKRAGFDGVEIHGANGYLINQFMNRASNNREDEYGVQNFENRARFTLEVLEQVVAGFGNESRVGIRFSPITTVLGLIAEEDAVDFYTYLLGQIAERFPKLAYVTILGDFAGQNDVDVKTFRDAYKGKTLTGSVNFDFAKTEEYLKKGYLDAVHIGRPFIANPDLVRRWNNKLKLSDVDWSNIYSSGEQGYTDYQRHE